MATHPAMPIGRATIADVLTSGVSLHGIHPGIIAAIILGMTVIGIGMILGIIAIMLGTILGIIVPTITMAGDGAATTAATIIAIIGLIMVG